MAINITKEMFEAVCPSAMMPDEHLIIAISAYFGEAESKLRTLASDPIIDFIRNCTDLSVIPDNPKESLWQACLRFMIARSYYEAIPHLDLVLTPTGFGVVSNQNVAPASSERVERLRTHMRRKWMDYLEDVLTLLRGFMGWHEWEGAKCHYSLFWHSKFLSKIGLKDPALDDLIEHRPELNAGEAVLKQLVSPEFYTEIVEAEMSDTANFFQSAAIDLGRNFVAAIVTDSASKWLHRDTLLSFLDSHIGEYPTYRSSSAYEANHFKPYENKQDDSCYFFG